MAAAPTIADSFGLSDYSSTNQSASVGIANPAPGRQIFFELWNGDLLVAPTVDSVFIGAVQMTKIADSEILYDSGRQLQAIYWASFPLGTTAVVSINLHNNPSGLGNCALIGIAYEVVGANQINPVFAAIADAQPGGVGPTLPIVVLSDGALLAFTTAGFYSGFPATFIGWADATQDGPGQFVLINSGAKVSQGIHGISPPTGSLNVNPIWSGAIVPISLSLVSLALPPPSLVPFGILGAASSEW